MINIQELDLGGKKVLLRVDFNVAVKKGKMEETFKVTACRETLDYISNQPGAKVALITHFGRPEGKINPEFSLEPLVKEIALLLGRKIVFVKSAAGPEVEEVMSGLNQSEIALLENVRFFPGEESNDEKFSELLAKPFDAYINDAFSVSHRDQASVSGVTKFISLKGAGFNLQKEVLAMEKIKSEVERPAVAIIGGAKIETKLPVIDFFAKHYDYVLVGGKIANEAIDQKKIFPQNVILPEDFIDDRLDLGEKTREKYASILHSAKTIVWNGPTGKFEEEKYAQSSKIILNASLESGAYFVVGGGDTLALLEACGKIDAPSFVSTGGGAMLDYLGGTRMPGIEELN